MRAAPILTALALATHQPEADACDPALDLSPVVIEEETPMDLFESVQGSEYPEIHLALGNSALTMMIAAMQEDNLIKANPAKPCWTGVSEQDPLAEDLLADLLVCATTLEGGGIQITAEATPREDLLSGAVMSEMILASNGDQDELHITYTDVSPFVLTPAEQIILSTEDTLESVVGFASESTAVSQANFPETSTVAEYKAHVEEALAAAAAELNR